MGVVSTRRRLLIHSRKPTGQGLLPGGLCTRSRAMYHRTSGDPHHVCVWTSKTTSNKGATKSTRKPPTTLWACARHRDRHRLLVTMTRFPSNRLHGLGVADVGSTLLSLA